MAEYGWIALLRGINVGGRNLVPMAELRALCEKNGCRGVSTYIQSGNIVFTSDVADRAELASLLEREVERAFGVSTPVVLRTFAELRAVADAHPFGPDTSHSHVSFLAGPPSPEGIASLSQVDVAPDRFDVSGNDMYLQYPNGVHGSRLTGALLERHLGVPGTTRNWRTVLRLAELAATA